MNLQEEKLWGVELETKVAEDYAKFYNHGEGPTSAVTIKTLCWTDVDVKLGQLS